MIFFRRVLLAPPSSFPLSYTVPKHAPRMRKNLRRRSILSMLEEPAPELTGAPQSRAVGALVAPQSEALASDVEEVIPQASSAIRGDEHDYVQSSHFESKFRAHTSHLEATSPTSRTQESSSSALRQFRDAESERRNLFAEAPTFRMKKSRALFQKELQMALKARHLAASSSSGDEGMQVTSIKPPSMYVDVPLMPPEYLRRRAAERAQTCGSVAASPSSISREDGAEQLHLAAARNVLQQSDEMQPFRCLKCFHVFSAKPSTLLASQVDQASRIEGDAIAQRKQQLMAIAKRPGLRKTLFSVGAQRKRFEKEPHCCPHCSSKKVQWMMQYAHHKVHGRVRGGSQHQS